MIMRKMVDLPAPFGPTRPTFSPRWMAADGLDEQDLRSVLLADLVEANHDCWLSSSAQRAYS